MTDPPLRDNDNENFSGRLRLIKEKNEKQIISRGEITELHINKGESHSAQFNKIKKKFFGTEY